MSGNARICACVAGWHFQEGPYHALCKIPELDVYLVSHRPLNEVPATILTLIGSDNILVASNKGYDWGCYEQFRRWGRWKDYEYVFFMHDDIDILSPDFVTACKEMLKKHYVVGNGRMSFARNTTEIAPEGYMHATWKPPSRHFRHDNVRGSFFATTSLALSKLGHFEVFWDRFNITSSTGNLSTKATCARWEHAIGPNCFGFLSELPLKSSFLNEHVRGRVVEERPNDNDWKAYLRHLIINVCYSRFGKLYMACYWREKLTVLRYPILGIGYIVSFLFAASHCCNKTNQTPD